MAITGAGLWKKIKEVFSKMGKAIGRAFKKVGEFLWNTVKAIVMIPPPDLSHHNGEAMLLWWDYPPKVDENKKDCFMRDIEGGFSDERESKELCISSQEFKG